MKKRCKKKRSAGPLSYVETKDMTEQAFRAPQHTGNSYTHTLINVNKKILTTNKFLFTTRIP